MIASGRSCWNYFLPEEIMMLSTTGLQDPGRDDDDDDNAAPAPAQIGQEQ
jgi:hypothetical protein